MSPVLIAFVLAATRAGRLRRAAESGSAAAAPGRRRALMDTTLFSIASFRNGNIATLIIGLGEFGIIAVLPLWLQFTLGYSAVQAGLCSYRSPSVASLRAARVSASPRMFHRSRWFESGWRWR